MSRRLCCKLNHYFSSHIATSILELIRKIILGYSRKESLLIGWKWNWHLKACNKLQRGTTARRSVKVKVKGSKTRKLYLRSIDRKVRKRCHHRIRRRRLKPVGLLGVSYPSIHIEININQVKLRYQALKNGHLPSQWLHPSITDPVPSLVIVSLDPNRSMPSADLFKTITVINHHRPWQTRHIKTRVGPIWTTETLEIRVFICHLVASPKWWLAISDQRNWLILAIKNSTRSTRPGSWKNLKKRKPFSRWKSSVTMNSRKNRSKSSTKKRPAITVSKNPLTETKATLWNISETSRKRSNS